MNNQTKQKVRFFSGPVRDFSSLGSKVKKQKFVCGFCGLPQLSKRKRTRHAKDCKEGLHTKSPNY